MLIQIDFRYGVPDPKKFSNISFMVTNGIQMIRSNKQKS